MCVPKIHVPLESVNVTIFKNTVFEDAIKMKSSGLAWGLNPKAPYKKGMWAHTETASHIKVEADPISAKGIIAKVIQLKIGGARI